MYKMITAAILTGSIALTGCSGMRAIPEQERNIERIVNAPGLTKEQIYIETKIWIAENFHSSKEVIEVDSRGDGLIIGNGVMNYPCTGMDCFGRDGHQVPFTMKIEIKDEKFKATFSNIRIKLPSMPPFQVASENPISQQGDMDKIKPALIQLTDDLLTSMQKHEETSNW